jgi:hypothetical protein
MHKLSKEKLKKIRDMEIDEIACKVFRWTISHNILPWFLNIRFFKFIKQMYLDTF